MQTIGFSQRHAQGTQAFQSWYSLAGAPATVSQYGPLFQPDSVEFKFRVVDGTKSVEVITGVHGTRIKKDGSIGVQQVSQWWGRTLPAGDHTPDWLDGARKAATEAFNAWLADAPSPLPV